MSIRRVLIDSFLLPQSFKASSKPDISEGDFVCPQAFGRNTFSDKNVGMAIGAIRESFRGDTLATFKELRIRGFNPGCVNVALGRRCLELAESWEPCPIIGQWEVLYAMWLYDKTWYEENQKNLIPIWPPLQGYLGTRGMLLNVKEIAEARDLKMPILVAHREHAQRCFFLAKKIFGKSVAVDTDPYQYPNGWFDKKSVQKWTRSPSAWLRYEMMARFHHRLHYWI